MTESATIPKLPPVRELISAEKIQRRVSELGKMISADYQGRAITAIGIMNGAMLFQADLIRKISVPVCIDTIPADSYRDTASSGSINLRGSLKLDLEGRDVLIIDEILDTGLTINRILAEIETMNPETIKTCILLNKKCKKKFDITPDYAGFEIPDHFVAGYGLDYHEFHRNLPYIGVVSDQK